MQRLLAAVLMLVSIGMSATANAAPERVFRVDDRDPSVIFQTGFSAWGTNTNLVEHIEGATCNLPAAGTATAQGSSYISTSEDTQVAMNVVRVRLQQMIRANLPPVVWLYTVRATPNVFNVARTFEASGQPLGIGRLRPAYRTALVLNEWVARGSIPRDLIVGAQRYEWVGNMPVAVANGFIPNPNYMDARTEANPGTMARTVLTDEQTTMGRLRATITDGARTVISACWCNSRSDGVASRASVPVAAGSSCTSQVSHLWPATPTFRFVPGPGTWQVDL